MKTESVNHPNHYGGKDNPYEAIKVIEAWDLNFNIGNTVKYLSRAGKKNPEKHVEDLEKARWYLDREISKLKQNENELLPFQKTLAELPEIYPKARHSSEELPEASQGTTA